MDKKIVAIYARVSTEHEAQLMALENQIQYYDTILEAHPEWEVYDRYIDEGITATSTKKRKNFIRMMKDAEDGKFEMIITREVSRFARNTVDALTETRKLKRMGIDVWFTDDNIRTLNDEDGELRLTIMATLAQNESKKTSMRVKAGQMISFQNAVPYGNGNILGYDRVGKEYVVNPEQAKTVRLIFKLYLEGYGVRSIQYELEKRGCLTSRGLKKWYASHISKTLNNPFYCGTIVYRKSFVPDYLEQKAVKNRGEVEQVIVEGKHEPIISKEDFYRAQEIKSKHKERIGGNQKGVKEMAEVWGPKLVCSCGSHFNRKAWFKDERGIHYAYQCYHQIKNGSASYRLKKGLSAEGMCDVPMLPTWKLQLQLAIIFRNFWKDKKQITTIVNGLLNNGYDGDPEQDKRLEEINHYKDLLQSLDKKMNNLIDMRLNETIDAEKYDVKRKELIKQQEEAKEKLESMDAGEKDEDVNLEKKLSLLKLALDRKFDFDEYEIPDCVIDAFVDKIIVHKDKFEWHLTLLEDYDKVMFSNTSGRKIKPTVEIWDNMGDPKNSNEQHRPL